MASSVDCNTVKALPDTLQRHISAAVDLFNPTAVVKELVDNALDARATTITVEVSADTVTIIQVRDNGIGIVPDDRLLVARRHCTSKIRDMDDLKRVAGSSLGFRGVALSSVAAESESLNITTRVEGEEVAAKLYFGPMGEVTKEEKAPTGIGTTVRVSGYMIRLGVRQKIARDNASRTLGEIRRLLQTYALARPSTRLSLRVLKAESQKGDFVYAPRLGVAPENAVFNALGRDVASQCLWSVWEENDFELRACLPRLDADWKKLSGIGAFVSIDSRPMSSPKGIARELERVFKERLKTAAGGLVECTKPFFYLDIKCPPESYDPNIEPAKDDVLFYDSTAVLNAVINLLSSVYPEPVKVYAPVQPDRQMMGACLPMPTSCIVDDEDDLTRLPAPPTIYLNKQLDPHCSPSATYPGMLTFQDSMYSLDDDDGVTAEIENRPSTTFTEAEGKTGAGQVMRLMNPWIIAKMNAPVRSRQTIYAPLQQPSPPPSDPAAGQLVPSQALATSRAHRSLRPPLYVRPSTTELTPSAHRSLNDKLRTEIFGGIEAEAAAGNRRRRPSTDEEDLERPWRASAPRRARTKAQIHGVPTSDVDVHVVPFEDINKPRLRTRRQMQPQLLQAQLRSVSKLGYPVDNGNPSAFHESTIIKDTSRATGDDLERAFSSPARSRTTDDQRIPLNESVSETLQLPHLPPAQPGARMIELPAREGNACMNKRRRTGSAAAGHMHRTRSAGLLLERVPANAKMQNTLYTADLAVDNIQEMIDVFNPVIDDDPPFLCSVSDEELQCWTGRLAKGLRKLRPGDETFADLADHIRVAVLKANDLC